MRKSRSKKRLAFSSVGAICHSYKHGELSFSCRLDDFDG